MAVTTRWMDTGWSRTVGLVVTTCVVFSVGACTAPGDAAGDATERAFEVVSLSSRPDMVTGGDALISVTGADLFDVTVTLNGTDVTSAFRPDGNAAEGLVGLVSGLAVGANELTVARAGGTTTATLILVNHPIDGPVFSGPHEQPFICQTEAFELVSGENLGVALDKSCSVERRVDYAYRSSDDDALKPIDDPMTHPVDLATTHILTDAEVPYIVRIETGTINRAVY